jgi:hypothetical protein
MPRRPGPPGERQLRARASRGSVPDKLPLVHVTAVWTANEIIRGGKLETRRCSIFKKEMLYFFVLRPAYRTKDGDEKSHQLTRFPVVFIVAPEAADPPFHVYPFDTGGAVNGAFAAQADRYVPLEDYELEPSHAAVAGHIGWAFGTLENYFDGHLRQDILDGVPEFESVTRGYVDVARMGRAGSNQHDKRASAVELAIGHDVDLKGNVLLAILPKQLLEGSSGDNAVLMARLNELDIQIETYDWQPNTMPDEFQEQIAEIARAWFRKKDWL